MADRKVEIAVETSLGMLAAATKITDMAAIRALTPWYEVAYETGSITRTIEPLRGDTTRRRCSSFVPSARFDHYDDSGSPVGLYTGSISWDMEVPMPGSGVAWSTTAVWHILRSRYALDTPAIATDTVTGVSAIRLTPATPASWDVGDLAVVTIDGLDYGFAVTGRTGNDIHIHPGLPSILGAGVTVRLCHRLHLKAGAEGSSIVVRDHQESTLWVGTFGRLGAHSWKRGADGRLIFSPTIEVGQWTTDNSNTDPFCADCACPAGGPAMLNSVVFQLSDEYCGDGGTLTAAPFSADSFVAGTLDARTWEHTVEIETEVRRGIHQPIAVCDIPMGDVNAMVNLGVCDYASSLADDPYNGPASRSASQFAGPLGAGAGVLFWQAGLQLDSVPDDLDNEGIKEQQNYTFKAGPACPFDASTPGVGGVVSDVNLAGVLIGLVQ